MRGLGLGLLLALSLLVGGCGRSVPPVPPEARDQAPLTLPVGTWIAQGRMQLVAPGLRISCRLIFRREDARIIAQCLDDSGVSLLSFTLDRDSEQVSESVGALAEHAGLLAASLRLAYLPAPESKRTWHDARLVQHDGAIERWYGGDPILLRHVRGNDWPLWLSDYRPVADSLWPFAVYADGPLNVALTLRIQQLRPQAPTATH